MTMKTTSFRLLSLIVVMFAMSLPSQASQIIETIRHATNYYSRTTAYAVGAGKVYVSYNTQSSNPEYTAPSSEAHTGEDGVSGSGPHTYYLYAQANDGCRFDAWYRDANCTDKADSANPYQVQVSSQRGNDMPSDGTGADHRFYAKFVPFVTVGSAGYTTYVTPAAVSFPSEVTAYIVTAATGSSVTMEEVTSVPAGTDVVVKGAAGTYDLTEVDSADEPTGNMLHVSNGDVTGDTGIYALANKNNVVGFYPVSASVTIPAGKAYLQISAGAKPFFGLEDDDATAIEMVNESSMNDEPVYNIAGQRIQKMQKGINIVNGKKILK